MLIFFINKLCLAVCFSLDETACQPYFFPVFSCLIGPAVFHSLLTTVILHQKFTIPICVCL